MKLLKPSANYYHECVIVNADGAATDADSLPSATATKNGTDDAAFTLTVTKIDTGRYKLTGTVPAGYSPGDQVQISVAALVSEIPGKGIVDSFQVVAANVYDSIVAGTDYLDANVAQWLGTTAPTAPPTKEAIATQVEAQILAEDDGRAVEQAIVDKIAAANPSLSGLTLLAIAQHVRTELATELARLDAAVSTRLASAGYTAPPSDYQQRGVAVTLPSGVATEAKQDAISAAIAAGVVLTGAERNAVADALLDRAAAIDSKTVRHTLQIMAAVLAGKASGGGTRLEKFTGLDGETPRVQVSVDAAGNRSAVSYD